MNRIVKPSLAPYSSHPEAEAGVSIPKRRTRNRTAKSLEARKPIVSVFGRDIAKVTGRAA
jgi:hypothetical protein